MGGRRNRTTKRLGLAAVAIVVAVAVPVVSRALGEDSTVTPVARLDVGDSTFWDGEHVASSRGGADAGFAYASAQPAQAAAADPCKTVFCRDYDVQVTEAGSTLRVAIDTSKRGECYGLEVLGPNGLRAMQATGQASIGMVCPERFGPQSYNIEIAVRTAAKGTWKVRAMGFDVEDWAYRLRARLEGPGLATTRPLAPNLIPWLPWEFGFVAPSSPKAGQEIDRRNPPGPPGTSCHPEEAPASKCLRFSAGLHVTGDGPMYIAFRDNKAFQHVYRADGTPQFADNEAKRQYDETPAGDADFHAAHGHRHFAAMMKYELLALDERPIGTGHKHGFCTVPQQIADWTGFDQDAQQSAMPSNEGLCDKWMSLPRGWGDIYRWQRTGQYLPYDAVADADGSMTAGSYVVRVTVDPDNLLVETDDTDNTAYAHIRVVDGATGTDDRVVICERGFGAGPWDPAKKTAEPEAFMWANRLRDSGAAPEACTAGP